VHLQLLYQISGLLESDLGTVIPSRFPRRLIKWASFVTSVVLKETILGASSFQNRAGRKPKSETPSDKIVLLTGAVCPKESL
jgi:hypothetical protein